MDFDRKLAGTFAAWSEMQRKLAAYNVIASASLDAGGGTVFRLRRSK